MPVVSFTLTGSDVWNVADADPFDAQAAPSRLLITTRNQGVAKGLGAAVREIRELKSADALTMLAAYAGRSVDALPKVADDIVRECGELPLAVAMAGAMLQDRPEGQWPTLLEQLKNADLEHLAADLRQYREHRSMLAALDVSVQELPEDVRLRYLDFAVFPEDIEVPERVLHQLWGAAGVKLFTAQQTVNVLADRSLLRRVNRSRRHEGDRRDDHPASPRNDEEVYLTLHDLQHDYVRAKGGDLVPRHARLVEAYRSTSPDRNLHAVEPDGYFFEHIARHVRDGEGTAALRSLLFDHRWLQAKLNATGVNALLADFELLDLAKDEPLRLLRDALRLSGHVLSRRPEELPSQLLGRLRGAPEQELQYACARVDSENVSPVLLPMWPSLQPPGGALLWTLEGHSNSVRAVVLSADGKGAVSASADGTLKVWDVETGQEKRTLKGHSESVNAQALSADGKAALSISADGTLKVWDVETGRERRTLRGHPHQVSVVALGVDGKVAVSVSAYGTLKAWDVETGQERWTVEGHTRQVKAVALSADGKMAVSASASGTLKVWDVKTGQERSTLKGHLGLVTAALSADGKTAVSGSDDGSLKVWDVETGRGRRMPEGHADQVTAVALSADGKTAVSGSIDKTLKVWDVKTGQARRTLKGHDGRVSAVVLGADGKTIISGSEDGTLKAWGMETGQERRALYGHTDQVRAVALSADGKTAVSGSIDKALKVWDVETAQVRRKLPGHTGHVEAVALSADGKMAVSGSTDETLKVWDVETGQERRMLWARAGQVKAVALSADGETVISCHRGGGSLKVWDVERGNVRRTLEGHGGGVHAVALSADGKTAVSGSDDGSLKVWDVEAGRERRTMMGYAHRVRAVALSADGKTVVFGSNDRALKVWDVETGQVRWMLEGHDDQVKAVALSADGRTAVSGSDDRTLKVWDVETGDCLASFTGESGFSALALSETMCVFAGDSAGHVHLLELRLGLDRPRGRS